jgi:hypothetical protein
MYELRVPWASQAIPLMPGTTIFRVIPLTAIAVNLAGASDLASTYWRSWF